ncbi:DUF736 domain-containing protein [Novosphingobium sp. B1]|uniref:DUF736 domain-containing protein n=1 Tax=Novosphingobium sp. B1 TaxID=1938756 RepID=UPI0009D8FD7B|nr:DUF736 domain-containing protein [Novosphingobium sp. B1]TXI09739.1 MAG: DUF736 domain-containing protein [Novosphingobium sp.]SMC35216.1 Uncharacterized conserved protein, DUF736 family [Novosphingobium sp. B1]
MARIGSFKKVSGELKGDIVTLGLQAKAVRFVPDSEASGNAPSHRIYVGDAEIGAAWEKRTSDNRPYLSVKLDDPSFVAPIFAQLFADEDGGYDLVWNRPVRRARD